MPYVDPRDANNRPIDYYSEIRKRNGPPPWRERIAASPAVRSLLLCWAAGTHTKPHRHPRAEEYFLIVDGVAEFRFDGGPTVRAEPGAHLYAPRGVAHEIKAVGDGPLVLHAIVAPNELDDEEPYV